MTIKYSRQKKDTDTNADASINLIAYEIIAERLAENNVPIDLLIQALDERFSEIFKTF